MKSTYLKGIPIPEPVFSLSVEPQSSHATDEFEAALDILARDDPSLRVRVLRARLWTRRLTHTPLPCDQITTDEDTGQKILSGLGELHLEVGVRPAGSQAGATRVMRARWPRRDSHET
jgi:elongation factor G